MCFFNTETERMKKNLVLVGMMGSGKSTIGKVISRKSGLEFIDTDELIEIQEKMKSLTVNARSSPTTWGRRKVIAAGER